MVPGMTAEIRTLEESDVADWVRAQYAGFHLGPSVDAEVVATRRSLIDLSRSRGRSTGAAAWRPSAACPGS